MAQPWPIGAVLWVIYLALEPYMRRRMPELLIGWARLLEGRFRDPRVGRDVLIGALFGTAVALVIHVVSGASAWFPFAGETTMPSFNLFERGGTNPLSYLVAVTLFALKPGVGNLAWYFLLSVLLRRKGLAVAALGVILFLISLGGENLALEIPAAWSSPALAVVVIVRFGMLANVAFWLFQALLTVVPPSLDLSSWYGDVCPARAAPAGRDHPVRLPHLGGEPAPLRRRPRRLNEYPRGKRRSRAAGGSAGRKGMARVTSSPPSGRFVRSKRWARP